MKAKREQMDEELRVINLFASNYARDLLSGLTVVKFDNIYKKEISKKI